MNHEVRESVLEPLMLTLGVFSLCLAVTGLALWVAL